MSVAHESPYFDATVLKKGELNLGTSIMAITYKDGVLLGADSRTSMGSTIANRVSDKITKIHENIYCCRSGSAADTQALSEMVRHYLDSYSVNYGRQPTTKTAAALFGKIIYENKNMLAASVIIAGWDPKSGGEVYNVSGSGKLSKLDYAIAGSGSTYVYGLCNQQWRLDMDREEAVAFVKMSLTQAIRWDGSSGGIIRMAHITKDGVERLVFTPDEYQLN